MADAAPASSTPSSYLDISTTSSEKDVAKAGTTTFGATSFSGVFQASYGDQAPRQSFLSQIPSNDRLWLYGGLAVAALVVVALFVGRGR